MWVCGGGPHLLESFNEAEKEGGRELADTLALSVAAPAWLLSARQHVASKPQLFPARWALLGRAGKGLSIFPEGSREQRQVPMGLLESSLGVRPGHPTLLWLCSWVLSAYLKLGAFTLKISFFLFKKNICFY